MAVTMIFVALIISLCGHSLPMSVSEAMAVENDGSARNIERPVIVQLKLREGVQIDYYQKKDGPTGPVFVKATGPLPEGVSIGIHGDGMLKNLQKEQDKAIKANPKTFYDELKYLLYSESGKILVTDSEQEDGRKFIPVTVGKSVIYIPLEKLTENNFVQEKQDIIGRAKFKILSNIIMDEAEQLKMPEGFKEIEENFKDLCLDCAVANRLGGLSIFSLTMDTFKVLRELDKTKESAALGVTQEKLLELRQLNVLCMMKELFSKNCNGLTERMEIFSQEIDQFAKKTLNVDNVCSVGTELSVIKSKMGNMSLAVQDGTSNKTSSESNQVDTSSSVSTPSQAPMTNPMPAQYAPTHYNSTQNQNNYAMPFLMMMMMNPSMNNGMMGGNSSYNYQWLFPFGMFGMGMGAYPIF